MLSDFERDGYAIHAGALVGEGLRLALADEFDEIVSGGVRHLLDRTSVRSVLNEPSLRSIIYALLGRRAFAYKATLFDKNSDVNWLVAWHQDISIPVSRRLDIEEWRGWSIKDQVQYVQPPDNILSALVALRLHLDACVANNGPLRVLARSHTFGKIHRTEIATMAGKFQENLVTGAIGSALLMRPLLVHASSKSAARGKRRRVLQLDFAAVDLPDGLDWHRRVSL